MNPEVKELLKRVAEEMNLSYTDVERAYKAPFELQSIIMRYRCDRDKGYFPSLRIPYFLIFYCPEWKKRKLMELNRRKQGLSEQKKEVDDETV